MKRNFPVVLIVLMMGLMLAGTAVAGDVDPRDLAFLTTDAPPGAVTGGNPAPWASAGVVSRSDVDFLTVDASFLTASTASRPSPGAPGVMDPADYRLIAGDGSRAETCQIALAAAIHPGC
jgi:hypothetical protein